MKAILFFIFLFPLSVQAQIISPVAGNGLETYNGDGGLADTTALSRPYGVAVDKNGNIYIADNFNQRIRKINTSGIITTIAGNGSPGYGGDGGLAVFATVAFPSAIAVDDTGNIYIADEANERIRKIDTAGIMHTVAGSGAYGYGGDGGAALSAEMASPTGVAVDGAGNIYFTDFDNNRVRKVSPPGVITTIAGNGTAGNSGDGGPATMAEIDEPLGVVTDKAGNVYFDDWYYGRVRKIDTSGTITTFAGSISGYGGDGGPATDAQLFGPSGLSIDTAGNIYVTDGGNNVVRKVNTSGYIYAYAGNSLAGYAGDNGLAIHAELNHPYGTAIDGSGNLLITDYENNRIRKVTLIPDTVALCTGDTTILNYFSAGAYFSANTGIASVAGNIAVGVAAGTTSFYYIAGFDTLASIFNVKRAPHPQLDTLPCCTVPNVYLSYQWYEAEGPTLIPGATSNSYSGGMGKWYVVVDSGGCTGRSDTGLVYESVPNVHPSNFNVAIYPNPATNTLSITASNKITQVTISNTIGQTIYTHEYNSETVQVDVSALPTGMYFMKINGAEVRKFIKE